MDNLRSEDGPLALKLKEFLGEGGELETALEKHFGDEGSVIYKILNPNDDSTPLGKFSKQLEELLDTEQEGTAFYKLKKCVEEGFQNLSKEVAVAAASAKSKAEEREKGTAKGRDWQEYITEILDEMAKPYEDEVIFVGDTRGISGDVGDVVIRLNVNETGGSDKKIVVECKKGKIKLSGKDSILLELDEAKQNRVADYGIAVVAEEYSPPQVGAFRRYDGGRIICGVPLDAYALSLEVAYKAARSELIASLQQKTGDLKPSDVLSKIGMISGSLEKFRAIKRSLSSIETDVGSVRDSLQSIEDEIKASVKELDDLIRNSCK